MPDFNMQLSPLSHPLVDEARQSLLYALDYLPKDARTQVMNACAFGDVAHIKDKRKSGEPYITHPIAVAEILAGFLLDKDTIIAAILHDTVEDTWVSLDDLEAQFGDDVARLVDGVTKLKSSSTPKDFAATFQKIIAATLQDPRVLLIKLADRLHNLSTLGAVPLHKQQKTARQTLDFYLPLARLLGLHDIADHIELLCYRRIDYTMYTQISDKLLQQGLGRKLKSERISIYLQTLLKAHKVQGVVRTLDNRAKMYAAFFANRGDISLITRAYEFEIITTDLDGLNTLQDAITARYDVHAIDHITSPMAGGNQSLKLCYQDNFDNITITLLTQKMHSSARLGVMGKHPAISRAVIEASLRNLQELGVHSDPSHAIDNLLDYLHARKIVCYSPKDGAYELSRGAIALDFAYAVGPRVGNIATGVLINGVSASLFDALQDGDVVQILTDPKATPRAEWLGVIATNKARESILKALKKLPQADQVEHGKSALARALLSVDKNLHDIDDNAWQDLLHWRGIDNMDTLFLQISQGKILPQLLLSRLLSDNPKNNDQLIKGAQGVELTLSKCCNPIVGDRILGHLSRHGLTVHRHKCYQVQEIQKQNPYQILRLEWSDAPQARFVACIKIQKMLSQEEISEAIFVLKSQHIGVLSVQSRPLELNLELMIKSREHLAQGIKSLREALDYPNIMRLYQMPHQTVRT